jgi:hypothetical protein
MQKSPYSLELDNFGLNMQYYGLDTVHALDVPNAYSASIDLNRRYKNPLLCKLVPLFCKINIQSVLLYGNALHNSGRVVFESHKL